jgi:MerR family copper efflux transcriptional regulator
MKATLQTLAQHCHGDDRPDCPILESLEAGACHEGPCGTGAA